MTRRPPSPPLAGPDHQLQLVNALRDPECYPHAVKSVNLVETHISWVLLAGRHAYKIKKAVNLGFLDFSDLAARHFYCEEEIRLNRRLAPRLYLDVVSIGGSPQQPVLGGEPALEFAVRMRRFAATLQMDRLLARGRVTLSHIDQLAGTMARFHAGLPPAAPDSAFGTPDAIRASMLENFRQLQPLLNAADRLQLDQLQALSEKHYAACAALFARRHQTGCIRECHGDLHLGNIVVLHDQPTPFDGIEFCANLRWIDVMSEVAFLVMDLLYRKRADLSFHFLNRYLEQSGDYAGIGVLRFYLAYRATVRAKISAICAHQAGVRKKQAAESMTACRNYLALATNFLALRRPALIITHGLPGCGKTTVAEAALQRLQAIRIRSDVERKRLFGLSPLQPSHSEIAGGIYSAEATEQTYAHLCDLARSLLLAGFPVIVDAAFLEHAERERFRSLARELALPFVILSVKASIPLLRSRISERRHLANDASEADISVLEALRKSQQPLTREELACSLDVVNEWAPDGQNFAQEMNRLQSMTHCPTLIEEATP